MNPTQAKNLLDGQFSICWQGVTWGNCFWRGGTQSSDVEEREYEANCGVTKTLKKFKKLMFSVEFTSWSTNHLGLLAPHIANGTAATTNGLRITTEGCSTTETTGGLYIELECVDAPDNTIYYPNATIAILEDDIDFTDDGGVAVSVTWDALPAGDDHQFPGTIVIFGQPDPDQAMEYDCATDTWNNV